MTKILDMPREYAELSPEKPVFESFLENSVPSHTSEMVNGTFSFRGSLSEIENAQSAWDTIIDYFDADPNTESIAGSEDTILVTFKIPVGDIRQVEVTLERVGKPSPAAIKVNFH